MAKITGMRGGRSKSLSPKGAGQGAGTRPDRPCSGLLGLLRLLDVEVEGGGVAEGTGQLGVPGLQRAHLEEPVGPRARRPDAVVGGGLEAEVGVPPGVAEQDDRRLAAAGRP